MLLGCSEEELQAAPSWIEGPWSVQIKGGIRADKAESKGSWSSGPGEETRGSWQAPGHVNLVGHNAKFEFRRERNGGELPCLGSQAGRRGQQERSTMKTWKM